MSSIPVPPNVAPKRISGSPGRTPRLDITSRAIGIAFRSTFLVILAGAALWSSWPLGATLQSISNWSIGESLKSILGIGICAIALVNLFILPKDAGAYKAWTSMGLFGVAALAFFVTLKALA